MSDTNLNDASFTPEIQDSEESTNKQTYSATGSFRFWCQKVLPLVYDDSLSYYELLCKVVNYLNSVIQNVDNLNTSVDNTNTAFNNLQNYVNTTKDTLVEAYSELEQYVNDYFNNLDVQEEINTKLDAMASDGSLSKLLSPFIPSLVSEWLSKNITPTSPAIDASLSISGAGADAKVTGEQVRDLKSALNLKTEPLNNEVFENGSEISRYSNTDNFYMDENGTNIYDANFVTDKYIVSAGSLLHLNIAKDSAYVWAFRDGDRFASNVIGLVNSVGGSLFVKVPDGATHLFISRLKTTLSNTVFIAKSVVAKNTQNIEKNTNSLNVLADAINAKYQYLDSTLWESKKYYRAVNSVTNVDDAGYAVYPPLTIPAGTYHFSRINFDFTFASSFSQSSFKPFTTTSGVITFEEETTLYLTCQYPTTDYSKCMLANGIIPSSYVFGTYISKSLKIVDANGGGDYLTIQDAINDCKDLDEHNIQTGVHETILVYPGVYPRFSMGAGGNSVIARRSISIIGIDRQKCIIRDDNGLYKYPPAEIRTDGTIANLTFIATHDNGNSSTTESKDQYAVHLDYGYCAETFENCTFISYCNAAVGIGLYANEELTFRNCKFISYADSSEWGGTAPEGIYCHTNTANGTRNQNLTLIDCECISKNGQYGGAFQVIPNTGDSTQYLKLIRNLFYGNNGFDANIQSGWDTSMSYGNSVDIN